MKNQKIKIIPKRKADMWDRVEFNMFRILFNDRKNINLITCSRIHCPKRRIVSREEKQCRTVDIEM